MACSWQARAECWARWKAPGRPRGFLSGAAVRSGVLPLVLSCPSLLCPHTCALLPKSRLHSGPQAHGTRWHLVQASRPLLPAAHADAQAAWDWQPRPPPPPPLELREQFRQVSVSSVSNQGPGNVMTVSLCACVCLHHPHKGAAGLRSEVLPTVTQPQSGFLSKRFPALMASLGGHGLSEGVARKTWGGGGLPETRPVLVPGEI